MKMFKLIKAAAQLRTAQAEIKKLKSTIGEESKQQMENTELEDMEQEQTQVTLTQRLQAIEGMEMERILGGGF